MNDFYSCKAEFECDATAWGFNWRELIAEDTYRVRDNGSVVRKAKWINGKPCGGYY